MIERKYLILQRDCYEMRQGYGRKAIAFFPFDGGTSSQEYNTVIALREIVQQDLYDRPDYPEFCQGMLAPDSFWEEVLVYQEEINFELKRHRFPPLEGNYLTDSEPEALRISVLFPTKRRIGAPKFRPCAWFNRDDGRLYTLGSHQPLTPEQTKLFSGK